MTARNSQDHWLHKHQHKSCAFLNILTWAMDQIISSRETKLSWELGSISKHVKPDKTTITLKLMIDLSGCLFKPWFTIWLSHLGMLLDLKTDAAWDCGRDATAKVHTATTRVHRFDTTAGAPVRLNQDGIDSVMATLMATFRVPMELHWSCTCVFSYLVADVQCFSLASTIRFLGM